MKKLLKFVSITLVLSFAFITLGISEKASAVAGAPALTSFKINRYYNYDKTMFYSKNDNPTLSVDEFPLTIETTQMGYGNCTLYLDGNKLSEYGGYRTVSKTGIGYIARGFNTVFELRSSAISYKGFHTLKIVCVGSVSDSRSDSMSFYVA